VDVTKSQAFADSRDGVAAAATTAGVGFAVEAAGTADTDAEVSACFEQPVIAISASNK